jgi:2-methylcitrate dehydratase PrpD
MSAPIVAEALAAAVERARGRGVPAAMRETCERLLVDIGGLCVAARASDYVGAALASWEPGGDATAIGHARALDAAGAAFVNGTAAHGEDFDDTFEGGPVHAGAVIVPALLAAAERHRIAGKDLLFGMAVGAEVMCRASLVAPKRIHQAGFHPTAVLGAMGAAAGVAAALRVDARTWASAQGIAGSMASGIIEYLAEGTSTKRMHPGWAAQAGLRAVDLARAGFDGPRTVWEGTHGFMHAFARGAEGDWSQLLDGFGERWVAGTIAFKPYACGTMIHPYIDCARRISLSLGRGPGRGSGDGFSLDGRGPGRGSGDGFSLDGRGPGRGSGDGFSLDGRGSDDIAEIVCETAEGIVHRLWEPLEAKQRPPNGYAAKFSVPYCVAYAILTGNVPLDAFSDENACNPRVRALASKVRYVIDADNPYPNEYTGHVRVRSTAGKTIEQRQPHLRGGHHEPLQRAELEEKFRANCRYGGWPAERAEAWLETARGAFDAPVDLKPFRG